MRTEDIVPHRDECLVWAFSAFDLRLSANASDPLISAHRRVTRLPRFRVFPPARKHILSPAEKASEQRNLFGSRRRGSHARDGLWRETGRLDRLRALQHSQLLGDLRPFPVECGQPILQDCDLLDNVTRACDRIIPFGSASLAIPSSCSSHYISRGGAPPTRFRSPIIQSRPHSTHSLHGQRRRDAQLGISVAYVGHVRRDRSERQPS